METPEKPTRRDFVRQSAVSGLAAPALFAAGASASENETPMKEPQAPAIQKAKTARPVVIASANGNRFTNGGARTCVAEAFDRMMRGNDVLESLIAGVNIVELDPLDTSVGYGGLPNAEGVVQLDASCMHGPTRRAGGVACIEGVKTPSLVAHAVMQNTDHHLLAGSGAREFARQMGFTIEDDLNTEASRKIWLDWKRRLDPTHWLDPKKREEEAARARSEQLALGIIDPQHYYGTINCNGVNGKGEVCGVTTTSGLAFKIPGRVGDSPILGAGLYVDGEIGAAGSTGRGEANLFGLCSYLIVEQMRQGRSPKDAGMEALRRIQANTVEKHLLNENGLPNFSVKFYIVNARGDFAGVSLYDGKNQTFAVCTEKGPETLPCDALLPEQPAAF